MDIDKRAPQAPGHTTRTLGPSDSSDSGSDLAGSGPAPEGSLAPAGHLHGGADLDSDGDSAGTGDRAAADAEGAPVTPASDIAPDRIVGADEAGLGGGLDQAEEAQRGVRDDDAPADLDVDDDEAGLYAVAGGVTDEDLGDAVRSGPGERDAPASAARDPVSRPDPAGRT